MQNKIEDTATFAVIHLCIDIEYVARSFAHFVAINKSREGQDRFPGLIREVCLSNNETIAELIKKVFDFAAKCNVNSNEITRIDINSVVVIFCSVSVD